MADIVITRSSNIMHVDFGGSADRYSRYARNMVTGMHIGELKDSLGIETNILNDRKHQYKHEEFTTIATVSITDNTILYDELIKQL